MNKYFKKTAVIVDDSTYTRMLIKETLRMIDVDVVGEALSGKSAIDLITANNPSLVTIENIMPDMLSLEFLEILKTHQRIRTKIIIISRVDNHGMDLGVDAYILKPFTTIHLMDEIIRVLGI